MISIVNAALSREQDRASALELARVIKNYRADLRGAETARAHREKSAAALADARLRAERAAADRALREAHERERLKRVEAERKVRATEEAQRLAVEEERRRIELTRQAMVAERKKRLAEAERLRLEAEYERARVEAAAKAERERAAAERARAEAEVEKRRRRAAAEAEHVRLEEERGQRWINRPAPAPAPQPYGVSNEGAERLCAEWMRHLGVLDAAVTRYNADGGIDIHSVRFVAQVKNYVGSIAVADVRALFGVATADDKKALIFTSGSVTVEGLAFAERTGMALLRYDAVGGSLAGLNRLGEACVEYSIPEAFS